MLLKERKTTNTTNTTQTTSDSNGKERNKFQNDRKQLMSTKNTTV